VFDMKRREFITLLGGAATAWPLAARAQEAGSTARSASCGPATRLLCHHRWSAFSARTARVWVFVDGQNIAIELRYAQGGLKQLPELAAELVRLKVDVIYTSWRSRAPGSPNRQRRRSPLL